MANDFCYYLMEYTASMGYGFSSTNQLIYNLKKSLNRRGQSDWHYKEEAIQKVIGLIKRHILPNIAIPLTEVSFVPIPPSKMKTDPLYDDRILRILNGSINQTDANVLDIFSCKSNITPSHDTDVRPTIGAIERNLNIDENLVQDLRKNIILFDDVVTTGAHFVACRNAIKRIVPRLNFYGFFIARRAVPTPIS
jgi:hypothetical protein